MRDGFYYFELPNEFSSGDDVQNTTSAFRKKIFGLPDWEQVYSSLVQEVCTFSLILEKLTSQYGIQAVRMGDSSDGVKLFVDSLRAELLFKSTSTLISAPSSDARKVLAEIVSAQCYS